MAREEFIKSRDKMKKETLRILQIIAWIMGIIALALLVYGIIVNLINFAR